MSTVALINIHCFVSLFPVTRVTFFPFALRTFNFLNSLS